MYQELFDYMHAQHDVLMLESEMQEVVDICERIIKVDQFREASKRETSSEALNAVQVLNENLQDTLGFETEHRFDLITDGYCEIIEFGGVRLWSSEDDERSLLKDDYEPLLPFVKEKFRSLSNSMRMVALDFDHEDKKPVSQIA